MPIRPRVHQPAGSRRAAVQHREQYARSPERSTRQALYDWAWRKYSRRRLAEHPRCVRCYQAGRIRLATVTDHIRPHRGDVILFRDPHNHQSLCKSCHDRKTRIEDAPSSSAARRDPGAKPARDASLPDTTTMKVSP